MMGDCTTELDIRRIDDFITLFVKCPACGGRWAVMTALDPLDWAFCPRCGALDVRSGHGEE
ncbi:hypothetical protein [Paratractidigestivibacter sp.]|uniref:hypothetical protein n=1 Tax=Paratractidigestivibacter sp. TaxID=2847316 RepID=UPI002ABDDFE7|nr:hypothetical protein [Paratractidigestivibacter sp.]